jgi:GNAT superfamily N-acetyltransferase
MALARIRHLSNEPGNAIIRIMNAQLEFVIRPARPGDRAALLALSARLTIGVAPWRDPAKVAAAVRGWVESSLATAGDPGHAMLVAVAGGRVVGLVSLGQREHFSGEVDAYIGELVSEADGSGIGQALLAAAEEWAARRGLSRITLDTGARNDRARRFYGRAGYLEEDVRLTKAVTAAAG